MHKNQMQISRKILPFLLCTTLVACDNQPKCWDNVAKEHFRAMTFDTADQYGPMRAKAIVKIAAAKYNILDRTAPRCAAILKLQNDELRYIYYDVTWRTTENGDTAWTTVYNVTNM